MMWLRWLTLTGLLVLPVLKTADTGPDAGGAPFAPWNGAWRGEFVAYTADGAVRYRMQVEQAYRRVSAVLQRGVFVNRVPGREAERVHAENTVEHGKLLCRVHAVDANGQAVGPVREHRGRLVGPGHIIWYSDLGDGEFETFNERVDGDTYSIHGVGVYGPKPEDRHVFEAHYTRQ
ncbi:MAG: hypothetical protein ACE5EX_00215 [Phycisphaerae bacterium]